MWNPKDNMSLCAYWTAFDGVNLSGNNVVSLTDLSGSGNDLTAINNPQIVANGINGVQSIRFNGTNRLERILPINGITDLNNRSGWIVFKIEDINGVGYHNVFLLGGASYTSSGSNFMQLYNTNNSPIFYQNYTSNTLTGSILLSTTAFSLASTLSQEAHRFLSLRTGNILAILPAAISATYGNVSSGVTETTTTVDPTADFYLFITIQLASGSDSVVSSSYYLYKN